MPNLVPTLLPRLEAARLPGLDAGPKAVYPSYAGYSLANIPHSLCRWLGVPGFGIQPLAPEILDGYPGPFRHVVFLLVDGLGLNKLGQFLQAGKENERYALWNRLLGQGLLAPLTSIVPSTTTAALTTLWTGRTPAEHGVVGYEMWLKEYQMNANMILHAPASFQGDVGSLRRAGFDPETFLPVPTLGPHLAAHGVTTYAFQHMSIARSGLSTMLFPGVNVIPFRTLSDLWVSLPEGMDCHQLFEAAIRENVAFVPGDSFYASNGHAEEGRRHFRLNFSNAQPEQIREGIRRLGVAIKKQWAELHPAVFSR